MSLNSSQSKNVLIISHDVAGKTMAGPGIRYVSVARELSKHFDATLGLLNGNQEQAADISDKHGFRVETFTDKNFRQLFDGADYIFAQWLNTDMIRHAREQSKRLIFDLYAPVPIESLLSKYFSDTGFGTLEKQEHTKLVGIYAHFAAQGDYFICSNDRQRDLWLGHFLSQGLLIEHEATFTNPPRLIGLAPMGIDSDLPVHKTNVMRGVMAGLENDDFILLWTGGLWDWFDPLTVVKAVEEQHQRDSRIKLVFLGTRHPNKQIPNMGEAKKTIAYVQKNGLENKCVFFVDEWLPYEERINYLLEADAAIYAHKQSLETRFSHRSRVLDHIYAELPTIATPGDYLSDELIDSQGFGLVAERNVDELSASIQRLASDNDLRERITSTIANRKAEFHWDNTLQDLIHYIETTEPKSPLEPKNPPESATSAGLFFNIRRAIRKIKRYVL